MQQNMAAQLSVNKLGSVCRCYRQISWQHLIIQMEIWLQALWFLFSQCCMWLILANSVLLTNQASVCRLAASHSRNGEKNAFKI